MSFPFSSKFHPSLEKRTPKISTSQLTAKFCINAYIIQMQILLNRFNPRTDKILKKNIPKQISIIFLIMFAMFFGGRGFITLTFYNLVAHSSVGSGGGERRIAPSRNRKNCCRNLMLSSRGLYFRSGARNPRNI